MTSNLFLGKTSATRFFLLLISVFCLSTLGMAQDDALDKTKDVIIDQPADKVEDVFDEDTYDDLDDNDYDNDRDDMDDVYREKTSPSGSCAVKEHTECIEREKPTPADACPHTECIEREKPSACEMAVNRCAAEGTSERPLEVELRDLHDHPEEYYGKTVTVRAEVDDTFNANTFTIQDDGYESMVIKRGAACDKVEILEDKEWKDGLELRVTGVVEPFDRDKLECAYGPLDMESKDGDLFTRSPILIVSETPKTAELAPPPVITHEEPAPIVEAAPPEPLPAPEEEVAVAVIEEPAIEEPQALPRTASGLPLAGIAGLFSLLAAAGFGFYRR
jgi:hypothetical protein